MSVQRILILRYLLEEIENLRKGLNSGLNHSCNLSEIILFCQYLLYIRKCFLTEFLWIHGFNVFAVHPFHLHHVKNCRRFADVMIVKSLHQFFQGIDLPVLCRAPSQQSYKIHHSLCQKSLVNQILIGRVTGTL